ncbi:MAG: oligopeptide/dipeptide ABC transporter ATP-binding protein [Pseudomonadota bacterium]|jgi:peptide/nickel transport system ATP-binding protein|nr:oligopeptide/dipeptide ABC transporter ATP-binding protein [Pseudomonadota bacterium]
MTDNVMIRVEALKRYFYSTPPLLNRILEGRRKQIIRAVDGIDFEIKRGRCLSLVGESGCGKSTIARLIVGLYKPTSGYIVFGNDLSGDQVVSGQIGQKEQRMQMIFQDPYASLNPRWRVSKIVAEPIRHGKRLGDRAEIKRRVNTLLDQVGLSPSDGRKYPHEFSGGQRQRISIARALAGEPQFLVCDEPTSALDVSVQAQILNLMKELQQRYGLTYLFISHDLAVVYYISDDVGVMYLGRICELADTHTLFTRPRHPYTRFLLDAIPDLELTGRERLPVGGEVPSPISPPSGCAFHPRCPYADNRCQREVPQLLENQGARVACHAVQEGRLLDH